MVLKAKVEISDFEVSLFMDCVELCYSYIYYIYYYNCLFAPEVYKVYTSDFTMNFFPLGGMILDLFIEGPSYNSLMKSCGKHHSKQLKTPMICNPNISCCWMTVYVSDYMHDCESGEWTWDCNCEHVFHVFSMTVVKWCKSNVIVALRISTVNTAGSRTHTHTLTHWLAWTGGSQLCQYYLCACMHFTGAWTPWCSCTYSITVQV